jgi:D-sedoheptulose 7-phosphate isomerase
MIVIGFTGSKGRRFARLCDHALVTPHEVTPRVQEGHIAMGHAMCELVERALFPARRGSGARK